MRRNKWLAGIGIAIIAVIMIATGGFIYWANNPLSAQSAAFNSLQSDAVVRIETEPWYQFSPTEGSPQIGLILYPGGRVEALAYAPTARAIAEHGFLVVLPEMRLNLAVFSPDIAEEIIASYPDIDTWAIGGHSLGGAMAARYAYLNPERISGLVLWASYPAESNNLSDMDNIQVLSISATLDGLATQEDIAAAKNLLPADTTWIEIVGGNHAGFGYYGPQDGDNSASISQEEQQEIIVEATMQFLESLGSNIQ